jgi:hypothetical protein
MPILAQPFRLVINAESSDLIIRKIDGKGPAQYAPIPTRRAPC